MSKVYWSQVGPKDVAIRRSGIAEAGQLDELERLRKVACELPSEELPDFIGQLESVKAMAWARLSAPTSVVEHDELLDVEAAAKRLRVSRDYLYRHSQDYAFTRREGRKLLFSALGIEKHISRT